MHIAFKGGTLYLKKQVISRSVKHFNEKEISTGCLGTQRRNIQPSLKGTVSLVTGSTLKLEGGTRNQRGERKQDRNEGSFPIKVLDIKKD